MPRLFVDRMIRSAFTLAFITAVTSQVSLSAHGGGGGGGGHAGGGGGHAGGGGGGHVGGGYHGAGQSYHGGGNDHGGWSGNHGGYYGHGDYHHYDHPGHYDHYYHHDWHGGYYPYGGWYGGYYPGVYVETPAYTYYDYPLSSTSSNVYIDNYPDPSTNPNAVYSSDASYVQPVY